MSGSAYLHLVSEGVPSCDFSLEPEHTTCVIDVNASDTIIGIEWLDVTDAPEVVRVHLSRTEDGGVQLWLADERGARAVGTESVGEDELPTAVTCHYDQEHRLLGLTCSPELLPEHLRRRLRA